MEHPGICRRRWFQLSHVRLPGCCRNVVARRFQMNVQLLLGQASLEQLIGTAWLAQEEPQVAWL